MNDDCDDRFDSLVTRYSELLGVGWQCCESHDNYIYLAKQWYAHELVPTNN